ncbi:unnamed protein product [Haemonchus placei]|uniref:DOMON domain-containing protein n=1 Tax=Haemonchus placei TaxID=6290 RepID=A0A158QRX1_HAEPC|nr:unnamed protein product [Haemonchus placei]
MIVSFVVGLLLPSAWAAECSISNEDVSAEIEAVGDDVKVTFINPKIATGKWTAIAFGDKMKDLEVVIVKVEESPKAVTGFTKQYGPPTLDEEASVKTEQLTFKNGNLTFQFTRPLGKNGPREHSLEGCQTWNFVKEGPLEKGAIKGHKGSKIHKIEVCPGNCKEEEGTKKPDLRQMIVLFVVGLLVPSVWAGECSISSGDISAEIRAEGDRVKVKFVNPNIANDKWTGVAFGKKMVRS